MKKPEILVDERIRARMKAIAALRGMTLQKLTDVALGEWLAQQPELKAELTRCSAS
jgi:hypothetical protein